ncbi:pimeloyl-ACP methyl ester carboxylesterase [Pseudomonas sp. BIGb0408]|uniref:Pimeloyl-ACP methyl ester carboxylesterase n=1 Tax=Phytopseudomonas flavescens TaxID=29435 RepID=A0A7Y9XJF3_9GAMM|nr:MULTISPECIES: alpha/beta fold hydrolase [Pseudomonas]MCW2292924.1 pimeloyl-ACP methyl ester carboxylesterase [Pseudomonas sp. BIGb0408]NYH72506.1 pimeloyl-ACP methyl ester carboxylesterase [Pseudomonas flavescens]
MSLGFEEVRLRLPHIELAAQLHGPEDGIPVIALHGWLDNAASFSRLAPKLSGLRIVALDFAGHGHSDHRPPGAGYALWDYVHDVLLVAEQFGWQRFSLLGHSMGAIVSLVLAATFAERVQRLALIDGLVPPTTEADAAVANLGDSLRAQLALSAKRKPVYPSLERAAQVRQRGVGLVSFEAAELLAQRGLMPVPGGYTWRTDNRLTLPTPLRLTRAHVQAFVAALRCPTSLVLAEHGLLAQREGLQGLLAATAISVERLPGGHHLHLDDERGAQLVADCFNPFLNAP